ncbi:MAG: hypothetical protein NZ908_00410 [Candidatus Micrarchaeota archaeon]|nr:hypothetical protein [Candidatus Micrarchaeota archaeon]
MEKIPFLSKDPIQDLDLRNDSVERKVKSLLEDFLPDPERRSIILNLGQDSIRRLRDWIEKYGDWIEDKYNIRLRIVETGFVKPDGTRDIIVMKDRDIDEKDRKEEEIRNLVGSLNLPSSIKDELFLSLRSLVNGTRDSAIFNLNPNNANKIAEWAKRNGLSVEILSKYQNGTIDIQVTRHKGRVNSVQNQVMSRTTQRYDLNLPEILRVNWNNLYAGGLVNSFIALERFHSDNRAFVEWFNSLSDHKKLMFLSYILGKFYSAYPRLSATSPELWDKDVRNQFYTFVSRLDIQSQTEKFQIHLVRAERQAEMVVDILERNFRAKGADLRMIIGDKGMKELREGLNYTFMEFVFRDEDVRKLAEGISYEYFNKAYRFVLDLRDRSSHRHSPKDNISDQQLARIVLGTTITEKFFGVDRRLMLAIIGQETNFDESAYGRSGVGLTQQTRMGWIQFSIKFPNHYIDYLRNVKEIQVDYNVSMITRAFLADFSTVGIDEGNFLLQILTGTLTLIGKARELGIRDLRDMEGRRKELYELGAAYNGHPINKDYGRNIASSPFLNSKLWRG